MSSSFFSTTLLPSRWQLPPEHRHHGRPRLQQPQQRRGGHGGHHVPAGGRRWPGRPRRLQRPALAFVRKLEGGDAEGEGGRSPPPPPLSTRATDGESSVRFNSGCRVSCSPYTTTLQNTSILTSDVLSEKAVDTELLHRRGDEALAAVRITLLLFDSSFPVGGQVTLSFIRANRRIFAKNPAPNDVLRWSFLQC